MSKYFRRIRPLVAIMIALVVASCGTSDVAGPGDPASISITTQPSTLNSLGATIQLNATVQNSTAAPSWSSNLPGVVSVTAAGVATAVANGSAVITASVAGASATVTITVQQVTTAVTVTPSPLTFSSLEAQSQLTATAKDGNGSAVAGATMQWASADPSIATVNATSGLVTSKANGTTTITATVAGAAGISANATVTVDQTTASVNVSPAALNFASLEDTTRLTATAVDGNNNPVGSAAAAWLSTDPAIATVDASTGLVTAKANGTATVRATISGMSKDVTVTVQQVVTNVTVSPSPLALVGGLGDTGQLTAAPVDAKGHPVASATVVWSSSDTAAIAVNASSGLVTAKVKNGSASVTATVTTASGPKSGTVAVTVSDPPGPFAIDTSHDRLTLSPGNPKTIDVFAYDQDTGERVAFAVTAQAGCNFTAAGNGTTQATFTATAPGSTCYADITAENVSKRIDIVTYDPTWMEIGNGLYMAYTNQFTQVWTDGAWHTSGLTPARAWRPTLAGWWPVGDHVEPTYEWLPTTQDVPMVMLFDGTGTNGVNGSNLSAPIDYTKIWDNSIEGCAIYDLCSNRGASAAEWKPVCQDNVNWAPLGTVASGGGKPTVSATNPVAVCVSTAHTVRGAVEEVMAHYSDKNSGSSEDIRMYRVATPLNTLPPQEHRVPLYAGSAIGCPGYALTDCDGTSFNLLMVPLPAMDEGGSSRYPQLTGWEAMTPITTSVKRVRIPFTLLPSERVRSRVKGNVTTSPFYSVETRLLLTEVLGADNRCGVTDVVRSYTTTSWFETTKTNSFSQEYGIKLGAKGEAGFLGNGGEVSVELSATFNWTSSTSIGYGQESSNSIQITVPPRYYGAVIAKRALFRVYDEAGNQRPTTIESEGGLAQLNYTAANWKTNAQCGS